MSFSPTVRDHGKMLLECTAFRRMSEPCPPFSIVVDAGASAATLTVDLRQWSVEVKDNGKGISAEDMKVVGLRYGQRSWGLGGKEQNDGHSSLLNGVLLEFQPHPNAMRTH
jgi:hypothetical protein